MSTNVQIELVEGDALEIDADVLALKYARRHYGLDLRVADSLTAAGIDEAALQPAPGAFELVESRDAIPSASVLFVGVAAIDEFQYREIRDFARRVLSVLAQNAPDTRHVAVTIHGVGFGLDEVEAFESELAGFLDAIRSGDHPQPLERITIVEKDGGRVTRLRPVLDELYPAPSDDVAPPKRREATDERLRAAGYASESKSHVFVAMPYRDAMEDTYHYGIQGAVRDAGFLCERADLSSYVGDVMQWVQKRIKTASLVVADLTGANPNVYLEVGYAWGVGVPVVLLVDDADTLQFDVRGQRCLVYASIRELETLLRTELENLRKHGVT